MTRTSRLTPAFAEVIRRRRIKIGLSQEAIAEAAGVHHTYVGLLERGKRRPTLHVAERLARAMGKKLSALVAKRNAMRTEHRAETSAHFFQLRFFS
jgi:transcriptional regulator with XRE-family HTH domain